MENDPVVALIPYFNLVSFCREVVEGALPFCGRLILVDDGSTDQGCQERYPKQIELCVHTTNRGILTGMKRALERSFYCRALLGDFSRHSSLTDEEKNRFQKGVELVDELAHKAFS